MKVKCVRLLDHEGNEVMSSPWLKLGKIYHVLSIFIDAAGNRRFGVDSQPLGEWPSSAEHQAECFEVVSTAVPSNWRVWIHESSAIGISPQSWQVAGFAEALFEHDPSAYLVFEQERQVILAEEP
ncbi:MAG: hypothetical protein EOP38_10365 [Rubrivivax sp.]|nr:MAG: hypothetical protein EOP38_10365 [Rubrivivax sp.]